MKTILFLLTLLVATPGFARNIWLKPGDCAYIGQTTVCAMEEPHGRRFPEPTPQKSYCSCQYGTHSTEGGAPMKGYWLIMRDGESQWRIQNFLDDKSACNAASQQESACFR